MEKINNGQIIATVLRSTDYSIFKKLKGNRDVLNKRAVKIMNSIQTYGYIFNPIIVNEKMEVIDGQGRFDALQKMGLPVDYIIVHGIGRNECVALNAYCTNWTMKDYISSHCENGNENYKRLSALIDEFNGISIQTIIMLATGLISIPNDSIKKGTLNFTEDMKENTRKDLLFIQRFSKGLERVRGTKKNYEYALVFAKKCGASCDRLFDIVENNNLNPAPRLRDALDNISDLYNKRLQDSRKKIYLHKEYEDTMTDKYGWYATKWAVNK